MKTLDNVLVGVGALAVNGLLGLIMTYTAGIKEPIPFVMVSGVTAGVATSTFYAMYKVADYILPRK